MESKKAGAATGVLQLAAPRVTARADAALAKVGIASNPYLVALTDGSLSIERFRKSQKQFYFAVTFFSRPMAALVARIPDPRQRLDVLHNLVEEHGEFREAAFHQTTFRRFLTSIGAPEDPEEEAVWPCLRAFNSVLAASCLLDEVEVGVACMGVIEHAFSGISATIGKAVVDRGWVKRENLVHYALHAEIDPRHAEEFFKIVEPKMDDPARRYYVEQGLELGAYVFDRLFRDLHETSR